MFRNGVWNESAKNCRWLKMKIIQIFYVSGLCVNDILYIYPKNSNMPYQAWKKAILEENTPILDNFDSWIEEYEINEENMKKVVKNE